MTKVEGARGALDRLQSDELNVYPYRCVITRNRNASCLRCAKACTSGAIAVTDDGLVVNSELCVGCGTCATVCPTCALEARHPNDAVLYRSARDALVANDGVAVVVCDAKWQVAGASIDGQKVARVTCLGRVEESLICMLAARGAREIHLVHGDCADCPRNMACETYELVTETANGLLEAWDAPVRAELCSKLPRSVQASESLAMPYNGERRRFFEELGSVAGLGGQGREAVLDGPGLGAPASPMKVMADGTLPHCVPDRRERLLDSLAELGSPADVTLDTRLWGRVVIDPAECRSCYMCATFCPTGALRKFVDGDDAGVEHIPGDCVQCRCCTDVCPTGALVLHNDVMAAEILEGAVVERFVLPPVTDDRGGAHSMIGALRKIIHCDQLYER